MPRRSTRNRVTLRAPSRLPAKVSRPLLQAAADVFSRHKHLAVFIASVAWVLLLYWRAFSAPFVYDDLAQIVHNPNLASWHVFVQRFLAAPVSFTSDLGGAGGSTYRPLYWLTIFLDAKLWGIRPAGFHGTNLALHLANGWLGFVLLRRLHVAMPVATAACVVWLGLPINSEVVAWISARSYSLCSVFLLAGLLVALAYRRDGVKVQLLFYFAAALAALLSNELGVLLLPLTLLILSTETQFAWRRLVPLAAASLLADAGYFVLKGVVGARPSGSVTWVWSFGAIFWSYVGWILLPIQMSVERSTSVPANQVGAGTLLAAMGFLALAVSCFLLRKERSQLVAGLAWMALGLLPFCGFVTIYQGMAERFTYIASAGLAYAVAALALGFRGILRALLISCVTVWVLWGGWRLHERVADWSDPVALYTHSLVANPHSPSLNFNLAFSLRKEGDFQGARNAYLETIALQRDYPHALTSLGELYLEAGQLDNAEREFVRAIALFPNDSSAYTNLGIIFSERQLPRDAARMFSKAIENHATSPTPYYNLAVILQQAGHGDMALPLYKKVLELKPNDPDTLANMEKIQRTH